MITAKRIVLNMHMDTRLLFYDRLEENQNIFFHVGNAD